MRNRTSALLAAAVATIVIAVAVGSASANKLSVSSRTFRIVWSSLEFESSEGTLVRCPVTMEGSFHSSTLRKVSEALVGYITRAPLAASACTGGLAEAASFLTETLPWHIKYEAFTGTLPLITGIDLRLFPKREVIYIFGQACIYHPPPPGLRAIVGAVMGQLAQIVFEGSLVLLAGPLLCPTTISDGGTGRVSVLGATTVITVRLI